MTLPPQRLDELISLWNEIFMEADARISKSTTVSRDFAASMTDVLRAYRDAREWRSMDTAPLGTVVLLCDANGNRWTDVSPGECFIINGCGFPPVRWMPLPAPYIEGKDHG